MEKLNYIPSEMARNLSLQRTNIIGVIVPSISHPFFSELAEALETELYSLGYKMMLCCTKYKENSERKFIEMLKRQTMDGIIMGAHSLDVSIYEGLKEPVIAFDRYLNDNIPIVHCDHCTGGRLAAEAFYSMIVIMSLVLRGIRGCTLLLMITTGYFTKPCGSMA